MFWFEPTKLVTTSSLFVRLIIFSVLLTNWALTLQLAIVLTLRLPFPKMKFFKIMHPFEILLTSLAMLLMMIMNYPTFTGSPNFIKHLTKIHCWFQKMFYKTAVSTLYKNINCCEGEASNVLCHCIICARNGVNQMWILKNSKELLESL